MACAFVPYTLTDAHHEHVLLPDAAASLPPAAEDRDAGRTVCL